MKLFFYTVDTCSCINIKRILLMFYILDLSSGLSYTSKTMQNTDTYVRTSSSLVIGLQAL